MADFYKTANELETTFNMSYLDSKNIAYFSTGLLPMPAAGTNPSLPTLGNGRIRLAGFPLAGSAPARSQPGRRAVPELERQAGPGLDGGIQRIQLRPDSAGAAVQRIPEHGMTEANDVAIMNTAATQDLPAVLVWPEIKKVLETGPAPSKLAEESVTIINKWVTKKGASRIGKEQPKEPGAAIMDAAWGPIAEAVMHPVLGSAIPLFESINEVSNDPNSGGSSYGGGWYGYVYKDLKSLMGESVAQPYSHKYCGSGNLTACRESLWTAIQGAAEHLVSTQGPTPSAWRAAKVRIEFPPDPFYHYTMEWTNRSTFQQVIEFTEHEEEASSTR